MGQRNRRMEDQEPVWHLSKILLKEEGLNRQLKRANVSLGRRVE